jgi:hypothetical protein
LGTLSGIMTENLTFVKEALLLELESLPVFEMADLIVNLFPSALLIHMAFLCNCLQLLFVNLVLSRQENINTAAKSLPIPF